MHFLSEATNTLQREATIMSNQVIPVVYSLENVLMQTTRATPTINVLHEHLLTSLCTQFACLCTSDVCLSSNSS